MPPYRLYLEEGQDPVQTGAVANVDPEGNRYIQVSHYDLPLLLRDYPSEQTRLVTWRDDVGLVLETDLNRLGALPPDLLATYTQNTASIPAVGALQNLLGKTVVMLNRSPFFREEENRFLFHMAPQLPYSLRRLWLTNQVSVHGYSQRITQMEGSALGNRVILYGNQNVLYMMGEPSNPSLYALIVERAIGKYLDKFHPQLSAQYNETRFAHLEEGYARQAQGRNENVRARIRTRLAEAQRRVREHAETFERLLQAQQDALRDFVADVGAGPNETFTVRLRQMLNQGQILSTTWNGEYLEIILPGMAVPRRGRQEVLNVPPQVLRIQLHPAYAELRPLGNGQGHPAVTGRLIGSIAGIHDEIQSLRIDRVVQKVIEYLQRPVTVEDAVSNLYSEPTWDGNL